MLKRFLLVLAMASILPLAGLVADNGDCCKKKCMSCSKKCRLEPGAACKNRDYQPRTDSPRCCKDDCKEKPRCERSCEPKNCCKKSCCKPKCCKKCDCCKPKCEPKCCKKCVDCDCQRKCCPPDYYPWDQNDEGRN